MSCQWGHNNGIKPDWSIGNPFAIWYHAGQTSDLKIWNYAYLCWVIVMWLGIPTHIHVNWSTSRKKLKFIYCNRIKLMRRWPGFDTCSKWKKKHHCPKVYKRFFKGIPSRYALKNTDFKIPTGHHCKLTLDVWARFCGRNRLVISIAQNISGNRTLCDLASSKVRQPNVHG